MSTLLQRLQIKLQALAEDDAIIEELIERVSEHPEFVQKLAKKYLQLKDRFYQPFEKGSIEPRNGGFEFKETRDVLS